MPVLLLLGAVLAATARATPDDVTAEFMERLSDTVTWSQPAGGSAQLALTPLEEGTDSPPTLRLRVSAGHLELEWTQDIVVSHAPETTLIGVELPAEALLDPVLVDYVADLHGYVTVGGFTVRLPPAVVAWPNGAEGPAEIWTPEEMQRRAPYGVVSEELRAGLDPETLDGLQRLAPPIYRLSARPRTRRSDVPNDTGLVEVAP